MVGNLIPSCRAAQLTISWLGQYDCTFSVPLLNVLKICLEAILELNRAEQLKVDVRGHSEEGLDGLRLQFILHVELLDSDNSIGSLLFPIDFGS